ncbi:MAG: hypothetical protein ACLSVD_11620 [Eggerthellaceae bacterium]
MDDNDLNREIAITLLEDEGFTVECAVNGCEAVEGHGRTIRALPAGAHGRADAGHERLRGHKAIRRLNDRPERRCLSSL